MADEKKLTADDLEYREILAGPQGIWSDKRFLALSDAGRMLVMVLLTDAKVIKLVEDRLGCDAVTACNALDEIVGFEKYVRPIAKTLRLARFRGRRS